MIAIVLLLLAFRDAGSTGFASLLSTYSAVGKDIAAANAAIELKPRDAAAHLVKGALLEAKGNIAEAIEAYTQAIRLREDDYVLWLHLAHARDLNGQSTEAEAAARQAILLAPYYAQPHWQLGNILVRNGQFDEGFKELKLAAASDSIFLPAVIDLAWRISKEDIGFVQRALQPNTPDLYKALSEFLKKKNRWTEASEMFLAAGPGAEAERKLFLTELISNRKFSEAAKVWAMDHPEAKSMISNIRNAGFEQEGDLDEPGFSWRQENKAKAVSISLDPNNPKEGRTSLVVAFDGEANPAEPIISQLLLVEPNSHYRLHFSARTENLVSGGTPYIAISNPATNVILGQASPFPKQQIDWQDYVIDFQSADNAQTLQLALRRIPCSSGPCPVFGRLWLDNFSLIKQ